MREAWATTLREQWRTESIESVWLRPGDWYHPAIDALTEALAAGMPAARASVSASMAGWYQSPGRSHTDSMLSVRHCSRSVVAQASRIWSVAVTPGESGHDRGHDAASWPGHIRVLRSRHPFARQTRPFWALRTTNEA